ncbi:MAG: YetF domain-containing protein [Microcoleaceae cyanobacterium]
MLFDSFETLLNTFIVGILAYIIIILLMRISGKRTLSKWNSFDFITTVAFGSILASVLLSKDTSLAQGSLGFAMLVTFQYAITFIAARSNVVQKLIKSEPTLLLYQGRFQEKTLKKERVTEGEVLAAIRANGKASVEDIAAVVLETDGKFSVITKMQGSSVSAMKDVRGFPKDVLAQNSFR